MNQVHKESLSSVENALPNRQGLEVEIFGMEGIPEDMVQQHNQRIIQNFYQAQADRRAATGNPPPGQESGPSPPKKYKTESAEGLEVRLKAFQDQIRTGGPVRNPSNDGAVVPDGHSPGHNVEPGAFVSEPPVFCAIPSLIKTKAPFPPPQAGFEFQSSFGAPGGPGGPGFARGAPPNYAAPALATRPPGGVAQASDLPQRPPFDSSYPPPDLATRQGDDIDQLIRMAEAGIKPARRDTAPAGEDVVEKGRKDKSMRMVYGDGDVSMEERMARMARYTVA